MSRKKALQEYVDDVKLTKAITSKLKEARLRSIIARGKGGKYTAPKKFKRRELTGVLAGRG